MIEVSRLSKHFDGFKAVDDVSFSIPTGQIVGLLGPNGAGKSTTMRMITGFLKATSGTILIDGIDISQDPVGAKQKIGYMPESAPLYSDMIVEDYLEYVAEMQNQDTDEKVKKLCEECGLKEVMHKNISELSRGYRQRVGLAHALMNDPEILILDEPTSGLDPNQIEDVRNLIREIGKTRTVIVSTHILGEVEMLCSRVIIISKGKLVADSPTAELRQRYGHSENVLLQVDGVSKDDFEKAIKELDSVENCSFIEDYGNSQIEKIPSAPNAIAVLVGAKEGTEIRNELFRLCSNKGWELYEMTLRKNSLEDIFHEITLSNQ